MESGSYQIGIHNLTLQYRVVRPEGTVRHRALLLSSPGQSAYSWRYIVPELTGEGCICVLCDLPGYGQNEGRADVPQDHETRARILWGLLDQLDIDRDGRLNCWHLMAHGSACGTIAQMALLQPDSASSLLMLSPIFYPIISAPIRFLVQKPGFAKVIGAFLKRIILSPKRFKKAASFIYGAPLTEKTLSQMRAAAMRLIGQEEMLRQLMLNGYALDMSRLNDLFMPTMILWGGRDPILGGRIPDRLRYREFKTAEYHVLPGCGHCPAETGSRAVRDYLRGWIRELWVGE